MWLRFLGGGVDGIIKITSVKILATVLFYVCIFVGCGTYK